ncbi:Condensin-2 complex subunit D3 [Eumeta japonica]|uniref:Condensin-2 complex subunit D3 n=1 Tax=Eumeta variegata TaxID=151549 RepID=A0A4C1W026_EUMVA|nr:Condensin-2 complex subunit D3 [Eumeta japonica]
MQLIKELRVLNLETLDAEWTERMFDSEFLQCEEIPSDYEAILENENIQAALENAITALSDDPQFSWADLSNILEYRKLLALLFYFIDFGHKNVFTKEYRDRALSAARLYYGFLSISGYKAYGIYHPQLLTCSLVCFNFPRVMADYAENCNDVRDVSRELNRLVKQLHLLIWDLQKVMRDLQLQPSDFNFDEILNSLLDVTNTPISLKFNIDKLELDRMSTVVYEIMDGLMHGPDAAPNAIALCRLYKLLLPRFLAVSNDSRPFSRTVRAALATYAGALLVQYGDVALQGYSILLQHLCHHIPGLERLEVRTSRAGLVAGLASALPQRAHADFLAWLVRLVASARLQHRLIGVELVSKLLMDSTMNQQDDQPHATSPNAFQGNEDVTQDDSGVAELADTEHDERCTLEARAYSLPYSQFLEALAQRVCDVSGTIRSRALRTITECVRSEYPRLRQAVLSAFAQQSWARAIALAARCLSDDRAAVRREAVTLLDTLLVIDDALLNETNLGVLVSVCRDAAVSVRSAAVAALGERALHNPLPAVFDAFLAGPVRQLSDPETKVQEQVVMFVREMIFNRLQPYSSDENWNVLPWPFLAAFVRQNMRRHLQKACAILAADHKAVCVNHRVVDILSTHLRLQDETHALQSLAFLSCLARHVDYPETDFLLDFYNDLVDDAKPTQHDERLLPLTLEILTEWSSRVKDERRDKLRSSLIGLVREARPVVAACRGACMTLAAHLHPTNLQWATDLMHIYAAHAVADAEFEAAVCAADVSLVAPSPPPAELVRQLMSWVAAADDRDAATRGRLIAALGRLCLRSRATAAEAAPALAETLSCRTAPLPARLNSLLALADICTRYTCILEQRLDAVCVGLEHETPPELRRAAARALTRLLLGGYLRLRPPLYFKYCALLADDQPEVREPAEYYVSCCLPADAIYHHLVDCVRQYSAPADSTTAHSHELPTEARHLIYDVMLQRLSTSQRLQTQCRLARELLAAAADHCEEGEPLPARTTAALLDAIALLSGPRMRPPRRPDPDDLTERVTANIISHKMKKTVAEVVVPAVLRLYARLRPTGGELVTRLVRFAIDLLTDYRQEIEELIQIDEELVEHVHEFQQAEGVTSVNASLGNARNLVTSSAAPEVDTPLTAPPRTPRAPRNVSAAKRLRM